MNYSQLIIEVEKYVQQYLEENRQDTLCFHDDHHTSDVVDAVKEMSTFYKLSEQDNFILIAAAYFHDLGYLCGGAVEHEKRSVDLVTNFLNQFEIPSEEREKIKNCILATRIPQTPRTFLEEIICDADLFHLGGASFEKRNKLMHKEAELVKGIHIGKSAWRDMTILFLKAHNYHTEYARNKLSQGKEDNLKSLLEKQVKMDNKEVKEKDQKSKELNKKPERGIETMFRITSSNNQRLSDMADNKANILLTVNSIILSMVVAVLIRKLDNNNHLIIPTVLLLASVVITMVLSILSTIPKIPQGKFRKEDIEDKSANLLFFGNFYRTKFDDYRDGMEVVMNDSEFLYGMLVKDVYSQGVVLGRKYKLLRYAYGVFMFGLILSVLAFIIAIILV